MMTSYKMADEISINLAALRVLNPQVLIPYILNMYLITIVSADVLASKGADYKFRHISFIIHLSFNYF